MKEPQDAVVLSARLARAFPSLSAYSAATLAEELCAIERAQRRHAERACNGDYRRPKTNAELGYVKNAGTDPTFYFTHDPEAEERAEKRIERRVAVWRSKILDFAYGRDLDPQTQRRAWAEHEVTLQGDPRGRVLLLRLPNETEAETA